MPIQDVALKTYRKQWTIETGGERGSRGSVLAVQHDDDDDEFNKVLMGGLCTFKRLRTGGFWVAHMRMCLIVLLAGQPDSRARSLRAASLVEKGKKTVSLKNARTWELADAPIASCDWYYLPTPPLGQDMTQGQFLSGV